MQIFTLEIGVGEHRGIEALEHSESITAGHIVDAIIRAIEIVAKGLWSPGANVVRLLSKSNDESRLVWFRPTAALKGHLRRTRQKKVSTYRHKLHANDNIEGLCLLSMPERARAMAFISPSSDVARLWEAHALICEENELRHGPKTARKHQQKPGLAPY
jgi:hypothetical protein